MNKKNSRIQPKELFEVAWKEIQSLKLERKKKLESGEYFKENGEIRIKGRKPIAYFIQLPCSEELMPLKDAFKIICEMREKQDPNNAEIYRGIFHTGQAKSFWKRSGIKIEGK